LQQPDEFYTANPALTRIAKLSEYNPNLKGTAGDTDIYVFDSGVPGGRGADVWRHACQRNGRRDERHHLHRKRVGLAGQAVCDPAGQPERLFGHAAAARAGKPHELSR
jgi:hypothetical protein